MLAHEEKLGLKTGDEVDTEEILISIYEAEDGFRGTLDEVVAHEKKLGLATGSEHAALNEDDGQIYMVIYALYIYIHILCFPRETYIALLLEYEHLQPRFILAHLAYGCTCL